MVLDLLSLDFEAQSGILSNIGLYSYGTALLAYIMLIILTFITRRNKPLGYTLLAASCFTALWAAVITLSTLAAQPLVLLIQLTEVGRNAAWIFVLIRLIDFRLKGTGYFLSANRWLPSYILGVTLILAILVGSAPLVELTPSLFDTVLNVGFGIWP